MLSNLNITRSGPATFWLVALAVQLPLFLMYLYTMGSNPQYAYIFPLLLAIVYLTWSRFTVPLQFPNGRTVIVLLAVSMATLLLGSILRSPWFASVSFVLLGLSFLLTHKLGYLAIPLLAMVRLPIGYDAQINSFIVSMTSRVSSYVLDLLYVPHLALGGNIELADGNISIIDTTSGVQSVFAISGATLLLAAWRNRAVTLVPVYLAVALIWTVLANTLKVTLVAYATSRLELDLTEGLASIVMEALTILLTLLLIFSTDALIQFLFHPVGGDASGTFNPFTAAWEWMFRSGSTKVTSVYGYEEFEKRAVTPAITDARSLPPLRRLSFIAITVLGIVSLLPLSARALISTKTINADGVALIEPKADMFQGISNKVQYQFETSERKTGDAERGNNVDKWQITFAELTGALVLSHPHPGWQDLSIIYQSEDWIKVDSRAVQPSANNESRARLEVSRYKSRDGSNGYLIVTGVSSDGTILASTSADLMGLVDRCRQLLNPIDTSNPMSGSNAMLHLWIANENELSDETLDTLIDSVAEAREVLSKELVANNLNVTTN